ncbi:C2H2 type zinc-finger (2 copies) domain containing protein [Elaphomyces granulatus]
MTAVDSSVSSATSTFPYTCNTCLVAFRGSDAQREHMRRDWHLYNVKRRVASLPPVSQEVFTEKVLTAKATSSAAAAKASFQITCAPCQKTFYSENSFQNHIKSSKHKLREARLKPTEGPVDDASSVISSTFSLGEPINRDAAAAVSISGSGVNALANGLKAINIEEDDDEEEDDSEAEFSLLRCLFCGDHSSVLKANVDHMFKIHGMFIPEQDYLVDLEGLIRYLHDKISQNYECLYCHAFKSTAPGIRRHMRDKGHCMIAFETEEDQIEIGQFYDFSSTYSDNEDEPRRTNVLAENMAMVSSSHADDDGWETDGSSTSVDSTNNSEAYVGPQPVFQTDYELHLPSGRSVGHRSLAKYYRQNLHNYPTAEERITHQLAIESGATQEGELEKIRNHHRAVITRANGGFGLLGATASKKQEALTAERRERTRAQRGELKYTAKLNKAANHQKHFRDPLLQ